MPWITPKTLFLSSISVISFIESDFASRASVTKYSSSVITDLSSRNSFLTISVSLSSKKVAGKAARITSPNLQ